MERIAGRTKPSPEVVIWTPYSQVRRGLVDFHTNMWLGGHTREWLLGV